MNRLGDAGTRSAAGDNLHDISSVGLISPCFVDADLIQTHRGACSEVAHSTETTCRYPDQVGSRRGIEFAPTGLTRVAGRAEVLRANSRRAATAIATSSATAATSCAGRGKNRSLQFAVRMRNGSILVAMPYQANSTAAVSTALTGTS